MDESILTYKVSLKRQVLRHFDGEILSVAKER